MRQKDVLALCVSCIHLSHNPPVARSTEPIWYEAMARPLKQLQDLKDKYRCPILCCGDVFDTWRTSPELINFALGHLPEMYAVPGNHDLPYHSYAEIHKSPFWTLVQARRIHLLGSRKPVEVGHGLICYGTPYGFPIQRPKERTSLCLNVGVIHHYIWTRDKGCPGAAVEDRVGKMMKHLKGYDVAVFGDNHQGFVASKSDCPVFNCGAFMRRKMDEINYKPMVGMLLAGGSIEPHYLDVSDDKYINITEAARLVEKASDVDATKLIEELRLGAEKSINFVEAVKRYLIDNGIGRRIKQVVLLALEAKG